MKLSIIIVNYNVTQVLENCLHSLCTYVKDVEYEVIVLDNGSKDDSWKILIQQFPQFHFQALEKNLGFSKANNLGAQLAKGEYLLLLNPDTELEGEYLKEILDFCDKQKDFGCLGIQFHDKDGKFLPECKRSVPDVMNSFGKLFLNFNKTDKKKSYYRNDIAKNEIAQVEVITGAFLLIKRETYLEIGGLDEQYFMYGEDIDLCYTLLQHGYKNWYYGKHQMLHIKGESTIKDRKYLENFYGAMKIFIDKYYRKQKPIQYLFLRAGLQLKYFSELNNLK